MFVKVDFYQGYEILMYRYEFINHKTGLRFMIYNGETVLDGFKSIKASWTFIDNNLEKKP